MNTLCTLALKLFDSLKLFLTSVLDLLPNKEATNAIARYRKRRAAHSGHWLHRQKARSGSVLIYHLPDFQIRKKAVT
jgi:hypothetical protein